ncbi:tryptophan synthase subunit alpha [Desulfofundulus salinus]|uniref:Tryptophan synthase alpha chain n=1 Tax=Desulfofundulus salinus TaxID=2419843 RepID=A0A494WTX2_9FIRM|nr:tryptophan synthase subunit alpha [Desulfofundulus salinum]RKO66846.1 tryptophan synthase subunit alpha [Desulfofundulus salinum]
MKGNRITQRFSALAQEGKKGLITYITAGDPDLDTTARLVETMIEAGADLVEVGIPFSDPVADGPVIQQASARALANGVRVKDIIRMCAGIRQKSTGVPLILMTYYNPVFQYGLENFARDAARAGVDGLIVPDLPFEESEELLGHTDRYGLALIPLVAPTTTEKRLAAMAPAVRGFVYCVSVTGVTGAREEIHTDLAKFMQKVRRHIQLPCAIGFGIAGPAQAAAVAPYCDAMVVGSAIVDLVARAGTGDPAPAVASLVREIKCAIEKCA